MITINLKRFINCLFGISLSLHAFSQAPAIVSFTPASGNIGTKVTISGTNFSATPANNIVYFGAVKAIVTIASPTQLVATVPVGATYKPITVTVNHLTGYSANPFVTTFAGRDTLSLSESFDKPVKFPTILTPGYMVAADFDVDGKADIVVVNSNDGSLEARTFTVFKNKSQPKNIKFEAPKNFTTSIGARKIVTGDLDGDGKLDIAIANFDGSTVSVYRNISTQDAINFTERTDYPVPINGADGLAIGDVDGDGKPDIVASGIKIAVLRNTSIGDTLSFAEKVEFAVPKNLCNNLALADVDGDNKPDIISTNYFDTSVAFFENQSVAGNILFSSPKVYKVGAVPYSICTIDLNGDNKIDIVNANTNESSLSLFKNNSLPGAINFTRQTIKNLPEAPVPISAGDLTGDGKPDMVVNNNSVEGLAITLLRNISDAGVIAFNQNATDKPDFIKGIGNTIADIDGDGKPDLLVGRGFNPFYLYIYRNRLSAVMPLTLLNFTGTRAAKGVQLSWQTTGETNTSVFNVQRSQNGTSFTNIGSVAAAGNSNSIKSYTFNDAALLAGNNFYRLKMVDTDGRFTYSNIIRIGFTEAEKTGIYPNPAASYIIINKLAGKTQGRIINMSGKTVKTITLSQNTQASITVSDLATGIYFVEWGSGKNVERRQFIVAR